MPDDMWVGLGAAVAEVAARAAAAPPTSWQGPAAETCAAEVRSAVAALDDAEAGVARAASKAREAG
ncbi:hypothetical protein [Aquipuribacter nitratireducens]|uniref:Uncharacterized protein n=1 Tax=Aquipuribacter nitratireducens TaxID=650104 RepID=A0ABW0GPZ4_9MICO